MMRGDWGKWSNSKRSNDTRMESRKWIVASIMSVCVIGYGRSRDRSRLYGMDAREKSERQKRKSSSKSIILVLLMSASWTDKGKRGAAKRASDMRVEREKYVQ